MFKKILNKHHLGSYSSDKSKSLQGRNMTIILVILLFLYIGLKIIFSDDETDSNDQDKLKEISIKVEDRNETDSTTNMIIYSSLNTGITCTVILRWAVKKKGYALWLWQEA